jgi:hypothetical protein
MVSILKDYAGSNKMIPGYLKEAYKNVPLDVPTSVLMRHSIRFPIESDAEIWTAGLTPEGVSLAMNFGNWLRKQHKVDRVETSPIIRCVDTGKWLIHDFHNGHIVKPVDVLAHPNEKGEYEQIDEYLETGIWPDRILKMANYLVPNENQRRALNMFISHDTVIIAMVAFWLGRDVRGPREWPRFLEPFFIWWQGEQLIANFRGESNVVTEVYQERLLDNTSETSKK